LLTASSDRSDPTPVVKSQPAIWENLLGYFFTIKVHQSDGRKDFFVVRPAHEVEMVSCNSLTSLLGVAEQARSGPRRDEDLLQNGYLYIGHVALQMLKQSPWYLYLSCSPLHAISTHQGLVATQGRYWVLLHSFLEPIRSRHGALPSWSTLIQVRSHWLHSHTTCEWNLTRVLIVSACTGRGGLCIRLQPCSFRLCATPPKVILLHWVI
jgi:hypothetical protein